MSNVELRDIPKIPWGKTAVLMVVLFVGLIAGWETYWRAQGATPSFRNSNGLWAMTRNRVSEGSNEVAFMGSSRVLFDIDPLTWAEETGGPIPMQLALEGTSPRPFLSDLANDPEFTGLAIVGVTPPLFFGADPGFRIAALQYRYDESPSQRVGQRLSMQAEKVFAFYNFDFAFWVAVRRQPFWPEREGMMWAPPYVRKLADMTEHRHSRMWDRVENDPDFNAIVTGDWMKFLGAPVPEVTPEEAQAFFEGILVSVKADVDAIRARGGDVAFVRMPSTGPFREVENMAFPRAVMWDGLLAHTDAVGVHFEDHEDMQGFTLPEWSHIVARETPAMTRAVLRALREAYAERGIQRPELGS